MKVANWYKWTRFKKRLIVLFFFLGIGFAGGVETADPTQVFSRGFLAIACLLVGLFIVFTIREEEW